MATTVHYVLRPTPISHHFVGNHCTPKARHIELTKDEYVVLKFLNELEYISPPPTSIIIQDIPYYDCSYHYPAQNEMVRTWYNDLTSMLIRVSEQQQQQQQRVWFSNLKTLTIHSTPDRNYVDTNALVKERTAYVNH